MHVSSALFAVDTVVRDFVDAGKSVVLQGSCMLLSLHYFTVEQDVCCKIVKKVHSML